VIKIIKIIYPFFCLVNGLDFSLVTDPLTVTFSPLFAQPITIPCCEVLNDTIIEEDETFALVIESVTSGFSNNIVTTGQAVFTIVDDDSKEKSYEQLDLILMI